jgi:Spy/CpxP family protein refolding chaperone
VKIHWGFICGACALGVVLAASAAGLEDQNGWMRQRASALFIHRIESELGISDAQRGKIKAVLKTEQPTIETLAARAHRELLDLSSKDTYDEAHVRNFARQHEATTEDILVEREKVRTEILQVLTPEQRVKAKRLSETLYGNFFRRLETIGDQL